MEQKNYIINLLNIQDKNITIDKIEFNNNTYSIFMSGSYAAGYPNMNFPHPVPMEMRVDRNDIYTIIANIGTNNGHFISNITLPKINFTSQELH